MTLAKPAVLETIDVASELCRVVSSPVLREPATFLMSFPATTAMNWLAARGRDQMFVWTCGINGSFSVIGAAAVPLIAARFGLSADLEVAAMTYARAMLAVLAMMRAR